MKSTAVSVSALIACALAPQAAIAGYEPGTTFIFSDGRVERVVEDKGEKIIWATRRGRTYERAANFAIPILKWKTSRQSGVRQVTGKVDALWPPTPGKHARFRIATDVTRNGETNRSIQLWTCSVSKETSVELPNGAFDALPVRCERYSVNSMTALERRTWWYSAEVGHYIQRDFQNYRTGERKKIRLCAALPPNRATQKRIDALAKAKC